MYRRTYRSKKDTGGGLDLKEMLHNMDEKESVFEAFSIQNIKQIKRELSCMGASNTNGAGSKRVPKRKYVKRLTKEDTQTPRDSICGSVFLTPNKSIRVNKAPDLFDQLLNSSPAAPREKMTKTEDLFDKVCAATPMKSKTYARKKKAAIKKFNYLSSSSSASDKENLVNNKDITTEDKTDIFLHKLIIEKEAQQSTEIDESINNIVRKLTDNVNIRRSGALKNNFKCNMHRLTRNLPSPLLKTSPLCSTPFTEKGRSKSIYNFSPIPMGNLEESPNYVTVVENENDFEKSIIFVPRNNSYCLKKSHNEDLKSTASQLIGNNVSIHKGNSKPLFSSENDTQDESSKKSKDLRVESLKGFSVKEDYKDNVLSSIQPCEIEPVKLGFNIDKVDIDKTFEEKLRSKSNDNFSPILKGNLEDSQNNIVEHEKKIEKSIMCVPKSNNHSMKSCNEDIMSTASLTSKNDTQGDCSKKSAKIKIDSRVGLSKKQNSKSNELSSIETSEMEPFLGFGIDKVVDLCTEENKEDSLIISVVPNNKSKESNKSVKDPHHDKYSLEENTSIIEYSIPADSFIGFTEQNDCSNIKNVLKNAIGILTKDMTMSSQPYLELTNITTLGDNYKQEEIGDISNDTVADLVSFETTQDRHTLYSTCDSEEYSSEEEILRVPVVKLERMDMELFNQYYIKKADQESVGEESVFEKDVDEGENKVDSEIYASFNDSGNEQEQPNTSSTDSDISSSQCGSETSADQDSVGGETVSENDVGEVEDEVCSEHFASFNDSGNEQEQIDTSSNALRGVISRQSCSESSEDTNSGDETMLDKSNEDRITSFVTTRKRNDFTNNSDSTILVLDDTQEIYSDEDKTVISNKVNVSPIDDVNVTIQNADNDITLVENKYQIEQNGPVENSNKPLVSEASISSVIMRNSKSLRDSCIHYNIEASKCPDIKPIILQPGKKWERSLSIYKRMTMANDHFDHSVLEDEDLHTKGRKYRISVITTMEMQDLSLLHNETFHSRRSTFIPKPSRSTIRIVKETTNSRINLSCTTSIDDLKGFLEECDDTIVELSKLSLADDHEVTVVDKFHEDSRIATARDYVLRRCNQAASIPFDECYPDSLLKNCRKIGEGVYGEVFLWRAPDGRARVMKVVPIAGLVKVNGEQQKDFHEIIAEIVIAMELSALRAQIPQIECHLQEGKDCDELDLHSVENATDVFNEVLAVRCVHGSYPSRLLDLWELYDECKGSENDNPAVLPADQQYIVLELANAGQDLESFQFNSAEQAYSLFLQVAFGLAVAEEAFQFEHRDLHWGNVLIAPTDQKYATFVLRGRAHRIPRRGVAATIIDYSLSRVSLPLGERTESAALYNDLATDEELFAASGDYQFEVYRLMRDKLGNEWKNFEPYTNILWLHYTVDKMITALRYKRPTTKTHKQYINKLKAIKQRILDYQSASHFVLTDNEY